MKIHTKQRIVGESAARTDEWRNHVGSEVQRHFSAHFVGQLCLYRPSSRVPWSRIRWSPFSRQQFFGKSTALIVGGSVCGGGGQNGFVQSWRATINGFEAIAELHNDGTLFLDELAQVDPHEPRLKPPTYLGNGQGKSRDDAQHGSPPPADLEVAVCFGWRTHVSGARCLGW